MAKSMAVRQAEYRARLTTRADLFEAANEARKKALRVQFAELDDRPLPFRMTPEERYARAFFLAHPLCSMFPRTDTGFADADPSRLTATYAEGHEIDAAAFIVAVKEVSSLPIALQCFTEDKMTGASEGDFENYFGEEIKRVKEIKQQLVNAGLWGAE